MRVAALSLTVLLAGWTAGRPAGATTVVPITIEALSARADDALVVMVRGAPRSHWVGGAIQSDVDLEVAGTLHGDVAAGTHVTVEIPGGRIGTIVQAIPGVPALEAGSTYVVFLTHVTGEPHGDRFWLTHLTASVLPMSTGADGTVTVLPAHEGMVVATAGMAVTPVTAMRREGVPLAALWARLRSGR